MDISLFDFPIKEICYSISDYEISI